MEKKGQKRKWVHNTSENGTRKPRDILYKEKREMGLMEDFAIVLYTYIYKRVIKLQFFFLVG